MLHDRDFARFFAGYATSLLGTSMSSLAVSFAVLDNGGTASDLGLVLAAGIVPQILFMLGGGVIADRLGRRPVMLGADVVRCGAQAALAGAVLAGRPALWVFILLAMARGTGDAAFTPALTGLTAELAPPDDLVNANALLSAARSAAAVAGPGLAGVLVALAGPALSSPWTPDPTGSACWPSRRSGSRPPGRRRAVPAARAAGQSYLGDLRDGWAEFRGRAWLVVTTVQFTLFNLLTWGPFLLLGPVLCRDYLGGAGAWGAVMACYGGGSVLGALLALGRRPRRPMVAATVAAFGYGVPCAVLALRGPLPVVAAGSLVAGIGSALGGTFAAAAEQQQLPPGVLARVSAFQTVTAFAFGPLAFAAAGPVAAVLGAGTVLGFGAAWSTLSCAVVLALPAVRAVTAAGRLRAAVPRPARGARPAQGRPPSLPPAQGRRARRRPGAARLARGRLARPEGCRLDAVLAGGGAEPAGAVAGRVHVDAIAARRRAHPDPAEQVAAQDHGQAGGAARRPARCHRVPGPVEVQVPRLAVVTVQPGVRAGGRDQLVDPAGSGVHVARGDRGEYGPERQREVMQFPGLGQRHIADVRAACAQRCRGRRRQAFRVQRRVRVAAFLAWREHVDEAGRHGHHHVHVTVEIHLTSYPPRPRL